MGRLIWWGIRFEGCFAAFLFHISMPHTTNQPKKEVGAVPLGQPPGAGDGNLTHATGLEGQGSAIELHPHK